MAIKRNDPFESDLTNDEILRRRAAQFDNELQADPELAEGTAGGGRIALFAIAIVAILGVVFYGLNNPSIAPISTAQTTTTAPSTPATPPAGQTTGSATTSPTSPPPASTPPAVNQLSPRDTNSGSTNMAPAPSPSNGGTTQSGPPANN